MKLATLVLRIALISTAPLTLVACGDKEATPTTPPADTTPAATSAEDETPTEPETVPPTSADPEIDPDNAAPAAADPEPEKEPEVDPDIVVDDSGRKWSKTGVALLEKAATMQHLPAQYGIKELGAVGKAKFSFAGQPPIDIIATPTWKNGESFAVGIELPESLMNTEMGPMMQSMFEMYFRLLLEHFYTGPTESLDRYDVELREKKGTKTVRLVPTGEALDYERRDFSFDENGRVEKELFTLHITGDDMTQQSLVGAEFELNLSYEKVGELDVVRSLTLYTPMGDMQLDATYHELDGGKRQFPNVLTVKMAMFPEPVDLTIGSYTIDGELAESTVIKEDEKADSNDGGPAVPDGE